MTPVEFFLKYPLQSVLGISILASFLFFPILFLVIAVLGWIYYTFINPEQAEPIKPKYDLPSARTSYKPTSTGQFMSAEAKSAYLQSPQWKSLVSKVKQRDGKCVVTGRTDNLEVHHIHYRNLGNESLSDLVLLNRDVHQAIHDKLGYDRTTEYPISAYRRISL